MSRKSRVNNSNIHGEILGDDDLLFIQTGKQTGLVQKLKRENTESEPGTSTLTSNKEKRKIGDHKEKVLCAACVQPTPPVDHMEELLKERLYREEDQVAAADQMYLEILGKIIAHNKAVNKNPQ